MQPVRQVRGRQLRRDVRELLERVAVEVAERRRPAVDEGEDPQAGPQRLDDRIGDVAAGLAEPLRSPRRGGRRRVAGDRGRSWSRSSTDRTTTADLNAAD